MRFYERFDLNIGLEEAQQRFVNRVYNEIYGSFLYSFSNDDRFALMRAMATGIGVRFRSGAPLDRVIGLDFLTNLKAIESLYESTPARNRPVITERIQRFLSESEVDLDVEWRDGKFWRKGAALLDQKLANDVLHWLRDSRYETVLKPYEKGLRHMMEAHVRKDNLFDVITDMYEAVEALAKIVTDRHGKDLSANVELFVSKVNGSNEYKALLRHYIEYANNFRHAATERKPKPPVNEREVESFVYLTGVFIRLAIP
jgi:hypothetical protein